ncbi:hypothetical protein PoB_001343100 [Plakobranchus ocellatus]|uniref:Uncharacterized protein n=1 Tax=Plakobranchus ocellatus TaxID=259542 RepID=A0AAV3YU07_9GAST|nr:hypothetical protein PoB_001343100 [Plakobranchus ocellatus]
MTGPMRHDYQAASSKNRFVCCGRSLRQAISGLSSKGAERTRGRRKLLKGSRDKGREYKDRERERLVRQDGTNKSRLYFVSSESRAGNPEEFE